MVPCSRMRTAAFLAGGALLLSVTGSPASQEAPAFSTRIYVHEQLGLNRDSQPVSGGIPFPQGAVYDPAGIRVYDIKGVPRPCQAHQLGMSWPDGSLRWALVQFEARVGAGVSCPYGLGALPKRPMPAPRQPVTVTEQADEVLVCTGPMQFVVSRSDCRLPNRIWVSESGEFTDAEKVLDDSATITLVADHEHMTPEEFAATGREPMDLAYFGMADTGTVKWRKIERDLDYSNRFTGPVDIRVEERGPMRAVLRIESTREKVEGDLGFIARIYAYAGKTYLRIELSVANYDEFPAVPCEPGPHSWGARAMSIANAKHIRRFQYSIRPLGTFGGGACGGAKGPARFVGSCALRQLRFEGGDALYGDGTVPTGYSGQAAGWIEVTDGARSVSLAAASFAEVAPKAVSFDAADGTLSLAFRPPAKGEPGYPLAAGRMRTYEFMVGFDTPGEQLSAMAQAPLRAYPEPDYVASTGAAPRFVPVSDTRFPGLAEYMRSTYDAAMAAELHGDIDYGDQIGWAADQRWNGYHGVTHEWFMFYLASGDPKYWRVAEANVRHSMDVDTFHWGEMAGAKEAEYARAYDHVCAAPIQGGIKVWNLGEVDYYYLTGSRRALETLRKSAQFLLRCGGVANGVFTTERATSLPFVHLSHIFGVLGPEAAVERLYPARMNATGGYPHRQDAISVEEAVPYLRTLKAISDHFNAVYDRGEHIQCSFLASYPAEGFHRFYELTGDPTAATGILKAASFLYNDMIVPTGTPKYAGGPPWSELSPWMPWWDGVEAPAALAYMVTGDTKYLDWGKAPVDWVLNLRGVAYSSGPWSWQGAMGFGGTLSTYLWAMREAGMTQKDLARMRTDIDYDVSLRAIMDRAMEYHEVSMHNSAESGTFCRLAAEAGRVMVNQGRCEEAIEWLSRWEAAPYGVYVRWVLDRAERLKAEGAPPGGGTGD